MTSFSHCPFCSVPVENHWRYPSASRLGRISRKRKADWWLVSPCCQQARAVLCTVPLTTDGMAAEAQRWHVARWERYDDPCAVKRGQIEEREAKLINLLTAPE